jgi:hypothetical protein
MSRTRARARPRDLSIANQPEGPAGRLPRLQMQEARLPFTISVRNKCQLSTNPEMRPNCSRRQTRMIYSRQIKAAHGFIGHQMQAMRQERVTYAHFVAGS